MDFDEIPFFLTNWSHDYLNDIDTSQYPFPNRLWHVKPAIEIAIKSTAMVVVAIVGIFLNSIILRILMKNRWLWTPSNYLIGNMALVDLMMLLLCPWFMLVRDFHQNYVLRHFGCRFEGFMQASLLLASVGAVVLVSYDRLAAAALTTEARVTKKAAPKLIFGSWLTAIALSLPWIIKREFKERPWLNYLEMFCVEDPEVLEIYWHFILLLLVWIPLGVLVITYGVILWRLEVGTRTLSSRGGGQALRKMRGNALRIAACVLLTAVVCRTPYTIMVYWRNMLGLEINAVDGGFTIMWFFANYLMFVNCAINPLIYGFTNIRFRKAMDRTYGVACFKFGSWCCTCSEIKKEKQIPEEKDVEKIFVIETSSRSSKKKLSRMIRNMFHINRDTIEVSTPKGDEITTKPTKITPLKVEYINEV